MFMQKLQKGDKVAIVSLSSGILGEEFIKHELELGIKRLKELGLEPVFMDNALKGIDALKNNPELRANDLKQAFADKNIKAIISAIGGNDAYKLIPYLLSDNEFIQNVKNNPKIFTGYSDTTTIHLTLNKLGLKTFYGPAFVTDFAEFESEMLPYTKKSIEYFFNPSSDYEITPSKYWYKERTDFSPSAVGSLREKFEETKKFEFICGNGTAQGELYGGCLEIIHSLANAQFEGANFIAENNSYETDSVEILSNFPILSSDDKLAGKILFLETSDGKPEPEKFREMIISLKEKNIFSKISGLLVGKPMDETYYNEYKQILKDELSSYNFPVVINLNFGHSFPRMVLPYGSTCKIDCETQKITLLDSAIK